MLNFFDGELVKLRERFSECEKKYPTLRLVMGQYLEDADGVKKRLQAEANSYGDASPIRLEELEAVIHWGRWHVDVNLSTWVSRTEAHAISFGTAGPSEPWKYWGYRYARPEKGRTAGGVLETQDWDKRNPDEGVLRFEEIANDAGNTLPTFSDSVFKTLPSSFHEGTVVDDYRYYFGAFRWIFFLFHLAWTGEAPPLHAHRQIDPTNRTEENLNLENLNSSIAINLFRASATAVDWLRVAHVGSATKSKHKGRKRGRPVDTNLKEDAKIFDAWKTGEYVGYEALGQAFGNLPKKEIERIIDRESKRRKRDTDSKN